MANKKDRWFLATNTDNLKMMVAQGLITSPDGFSPNKYYKDELENYPGFIPLFKNNIPTKTLVLIESEESNMTACLIEIDLAKITQGKAKNTKNELIAIDSEIADNLILLLAPLPLSCIKEIIFKSENDKKNLEKEQGLSSNFILVNLKLQSVKKDQKLFEEKESTLLNSDDDKGITFNLPNAERIDYKKVYAFGGLLTNLFYFAKNGEDSNKVFQGLINTNSFQMSGDIDCIYQYFSKTVSNDDLGEMYKRLIDAIINENDFKNDIINLLESNNWTDKLQSRTKELAQKLRNFEDNDTTISDKFQQAETPLERLLLMLFYRESSEKLTQVHFPLFVENDCLLFAMLFGVRDGFLKMPKFLRQYQDLQNFISFKMAEYAHKNIDGNMVFKPPTQPKTIRDLLNTPKERVIKNLNIKECINTTMKGDYQRKGSKSVYQGFIEPNYEIIEDKYFELMCKKNIDTEQYNELVKLK